MPFLWRTRRSGLCLNQGMRKITMLWTHMFMMTICFLHFIIVYMSSGKSSTYLYNFLIELFLIFSSETSSQPPVRTTISKQFNVIFTSTEQQIDGETLLGLTERMVEKLFPVMKHQVIFLRELEKLRNNSSLAQQEGPVPCNPLPTESNTHQGAQQSWPALYSLPPLPPELQEALQRKDSSFKKKDKSHLRSLLIQVLFDNITKYTWYPNHKKYADVLGCLITRFHHISERQQLLWLYTIQISPEDIDQTREIVLDLEVVGEDELSFKEHINAINNELHRRQPDFLNIKDRMKRSLNQRVGHMGKPTEEVMEMFPFLQVPLLMHHEMRLRFGQDLEINLQDALNVLTPNILRVARSVNQRDLLSSLLGTETNHDLQRSAAILILPILFKESSKLLYCLNEEPTSSFPTITFHDAENPLLAVKASIKMDGVTITSGEMDVPQALQCLLEVYYLFCVEFPKKMKHTLSFIEHVKNRLSIVLKMYNQLSERIMKCM
ncbi:hypothetical protein DPEC_G00088830 [Dallia pectoralis]|uniref:Uncharacterized protein n=1 Tax=Dallia pectoralis TaxID=75939 RepID=A0ACC2H075_DALPE|nr:hypothetical protein DPEC_G00088830 [Dallia pectoralis]